MNWYFSQHVVKTANKAPFKNRYYPALSMPNVLWVLHASQHDNGWRAAKSEGPDILYAKNISTTYNYIMHGGKRYYKDIFTIYIE